MFPLAAAAALAAQATPTPGQVFVPDNQATAGPIHNVPLGGKGPAGGFQWLRTQIVVPASFLPPEGCTITDIGLAAAETSHYTYQRLQVQLGHLPAGHSFTNRFDDNVDNTAVECLNRADGLPLRTTANGFNGLGLTTTFDHDGSRDLVVDIVVQGAFFAGTTPGTRRSSTLATTYAVNYRQPTGSATGSGPWNAGAKLMLTLDDGAVRIVGEGCPKADGVPPRIETGAPPTIGGTFDVRLRAADGAAAAIVLASLGDPLAPIDLTALGAPGCALRVRALASAVLGVDGNGHASVSFPVPNTSTLRGTRLSWQWLVRTPTANAAGITTTATLTIELR